MEGDLIAVARWALGPDPIPVLDGASVSLVRERVRDMAVRVGLPGVPAAALVNVASELANNQLAHASGGYVVVREALRGDDRGLEVVAADSGPGIRDVARALEGRPSRPGSLGVGLAAVLELADEIDVDTRLGEGTAVWARKFAQTESRRRRVGVYGRMCAGERTSGDDAVFVRRQHDGIVVGVADGLGHGDGARAASERARDVVLAHPGLEPDVLMARCDAALAGTRGAVMSIARIDEVRGSLALACVGNVAVQLVGPDGSNGFGGSSFVLGAKGGVRRTTLEQRAIEPSQALLLLSDGITSSARLEGDLALLREHPIVVAQRVVERFGRDNDDVMVLVVS
jgi:anti-sigma regulatory factor (Ser/Thr protein kinase)